MTKITEAQRELLTQAAADPDGAVDSPEDIKISRPLIKHGLAISLPVAGAGSRLVITNAGRALLTPDQPNDGRGAEPGAAAATADSDGKQPAEDSSVSPTNGSAIIAIDDGAAADQPDDGLVAGEETAALAPEDGEREPEPTEPEHAATLAAADKRPGGKLGQLVQLLCRPDGATLEEMVTATGWQAHSVRGAMSGGLKKKQGLTITSTKSDGTRVYRIAAGEQG